MDINVQELKEKFDKGDNFVLIDVREPMEHAQFNIGGRLIPLGVLSAVLPELQAQKNDEIVVYCRSGMRSAAAKQQMVQSGFSNVRNLIGGVLDWVDTFGPKV
jgi:rhodanese-related sulfurtransferase